MHGGISKGTSSKQLGCFDRWKRFLAHVGILDKWLKEFNQNQKIALISAFAAAVRRNFDGTTKRSQLSHSTVRDTVGSVRTTFRINNLEDPGADGSGNQSLFIARQLKKYQDEDPGSEGQKALPLQVFRRMINNRITSRDEFLGHLLVGALFFAMRSCEYSKVNGLPRKTRLLCVRNIVFYIQNKIMERDRDASKADYVAITFESQKNANKNETIIQHKNNKELCPVRSWSFVITTVLGFSGTDENTSINYY